MMPQQPTQQPAMGGGAPQGMPPPRPMGGAPMSAPQPGAGTPAQGMPQQPAQHGDPVSNFYNSLQQTLMPFVQKIPGLENVIAAVNQAHLSYLKGGGQTPMKMPGKPAGRMMQ